MAPPTTSVSVLKGDKMSKQPAQATGRKTSRSLSRDETPHIENLEVAADASIKNKTELAALFKSDLAGIKSLVTCSICDQLLYEPWTLSCGHTYCYSCLCNWFGLHRHKKTCPECRARIKEIPAPAFIIKQMVEIFTKQTELMPPDESVEQHNMKRHEEMADVERDRRNGNEGLFKGVFPKNRAELRFDDEDGVFRCTYCGNEHAGGPLCEVCGAEIDEEDMGDFSGVDEDDLDEDDIMGHYGRFGRDMDMFGMGMLPEPSFMLRRHFHRLDPDTISDNSEDEIDSEDDDDNSLQDFIVQDGADVRMRNEPGTGTMRDPVSLDSEDDSDEGGAVSNARFGRRPLREPARVVPTRSTSPSELSSISVSDSTDSSEIGDYDDQATVLRNAGWSPLDQGNDSDAEMPPHYSWNGYQDSEATGDEGSDTETIGNGALEDEDDDRSRDSETPHYDVPYQGEMAAYGSRAHPYGYADQYPNDDSDDLESNTGFSTMDQDGDTEMSLSPRFARANSQLSVEAELPSRESSVAEDGGYEYGQTGEDLGTVNEIYDLDAESSDSSIRPMPRRRPRTHHSIAASTPARVLQYPPPPLPSSEFMQPPGYNPRLSSMFAEHQQRLAHTQGIDGLDLGGWRVEVASSRPRRRTPPYEVQSSRRLDPLRNQRSPATRVVSTERARRNERGRIYRQYARNQ
ncbi:ring finger domain protein [Phlyctema vagabunda]|uniref:Ring finger domain protein n=1 Tax=Phlyctema vagabunda TaxID=108571 RepID=A0ABR4P3J1_9HELO